ncbi:unnamed protein product [Absidia cylindrospora]
MVQALSSFFALLMLSVVIIQGAPLTTRSKSHAPADESKMQVHGDPAAMEGYFMSQQNPAPCQVGTSQRAMKYQGDPSTQQTPPPPGGNRKPQLGFQGNTGVPEQNPPPPGGNRKPQLGFQGNTGVPEQNPGYLVQPSPKNPNGPSQPDQSGGISQERLE